ncbi:MAG: SMI1/KNR4 family protein [Planctomycetota bacterium]
MANWPHIIKSFFDKSDPENSFKRVSPKGCTKSEIATCELAIERELPQELRDFYLYSNGIGLQENESDSPRFIPVIQKLPEYIEICRRSFDETHAEYASRYLPFIDWENGDSSGFIFNSDGTVFDYIVMFSHEQYAYDSGQDINDFLFPFAESLEGLLRSEDGGG